MTGVLSLSSASIRCLAGGHTDAEGADILRRAHRSDMLVRIAAILVHASDRMPEATRRSGFESAFGELARMETIAAEPIDGLLRRPATYAWTEACLAGLRAGAPAGMDRHLAYLGGLAIAAAVILDEPATAVVASRAGRVIVPSIGAVPAPGASTDQLVPVAYADGRLTFDYDTGPLTVEVAARGSAHLLARRVVLRAAGFDVEFDDLDPYGQPYGEMPRRASGTALSRWRRQTSAAWQLLAGRHPRHMQSVAELWRAITPRDTEDRAAVSLTAADLPGNVALSFPDDARSMAATVVHESRHTALNLLQNVAPLAVETEPERLYYSPWRSDPRPLTSLLHGIFAFTAVADFWRTEMSAPGAGCEEATFEYARLRDQLRRAVAELTRSGTLTATGEVYTAEVAAVLDGWDSDPLPEHIARLSRIAVADHLQQWRLRSLIPEPEAVRRIADAWQASVEVPAVPDQAAVTAASAQPVLHTRLRLVRKLVRSGPTSAMPAGANGHLLRGDLAAAGRAFGAMIGERGTAYEGWAGVATCARLAECDDGVALALRPELVYAVFEHIRQVTGRAPDLSRFVHWLSAGRSWTPDLGVAD